MGTLSSTAESICRAWLPISEPHIKYQSWELVNRQSKASTIDFSRQHAGSTSLPGKHERARERQREKGNGFIWCASSVTVAECPFNHVCHLGKSCWSYVFLREIAFYACSIWQTISVEMNALVSAVEITVLPLCVWEREGGTVWVCEWEDEDGQNTVPKWCSRSVTA